jgi:hypothetical protein
VASRAVRAYPMPPAAPVTATTGIGWEREVLSGGDAGAGSAVSGGCTGLAASGGCTGLAASGG